MEGRMNTSISCRARALGAWALSALAIAALAGCGGGGSGASQLSTGSVVSSGSAQPPTISGAPATQVTSEDSYSFTPSASGPSGMGLTFSVVNQPSWAAFTASTGTLAGTPADADVGTFSNIVITVSDGQKTASLPAFNIWVRHRLVIGGTPPAQAAVGKLYTFTPSAAGPSNTPLGFTITNMPSWATFSATTGTLSGTPASANVGTYPNITISVSDGQKTVSLPTFSIQVTGSTTAQPPTISGSPTASVNAGQAYSFTPTASGPSGSTLTFSVANLPPWAAFSSSTGRLSGTPAGSNVGTFSNIVISVSDGQLSASLAPFSIQVKAVAPTISGTPGTSATVGQSYSFTPTASGPSGTTLVYSVSNLPSWATFSTTKGTLSGTPSSSNVGTSASITISVSDGEASASLHAFSITVKAQPPPTISGTPATTVTVGTAYAFTPTASGPTGLALSFSVANLPSWATFNATTGALTGKPTSAGTFSNITITVSDGLASASLPAFTITVNAQTTGSVPLSWVAPTTNTNGTTLTDLSGYIINYGTSPTDLSAQVTVATPTSTSYTITGLTTGTWYFSVTAYASDGMQSAASNTVSTAVN